VKQTLLVREAHANGRQVMQHVSSYSSFEQALVAGADQIHHSTLDAEIDDRLVAMARNSSVVSCPTLTMMRAIAAAHIGNATFPPAVATASKLLRAGVRIIAGTDSNNQPAAPATVRFGSSIHDELENLVEAGMSPVEALNAATVVPASVWGWGAEKGAIKEGMLADMVLVDGDATANVSVSRNIVKVWVGGLEFINA
jgi:imidazolonepropionase-like amidohydrolase